MSKMTRDFNARTARLDVLRNPPKDMRTGILDDKGREVTAQAFMGTVEAVEGPINAYFTHMGLPVGRYFYATVQACRNGESYGASQGAVYFTDSLERDAYVEKRFDQIAKAAAKKFSK